MDNSAHTSGDPRGKLPPRVPLPARSAMFTQSLPAAGEGRSPRRAWGNERTGANVKCWWGSTQLVENKPVNGARSSARRPLLPWALSAAVTSPPPPVTCLSYPQHVASRNRVKSLKTQLSVISTSQQNRSFLKKRRNLTPAEPPLVTHHSPLRFWSGMPGANPAPNHISRAPRAEARRHMGESEECRL